MVFKAALQRAARARTLALAAARGDGRPMRMHTYGSRRCGSAGSGGGKGRERISSSCTQSDEDSAPVGEQQLVKKSLAGFTCRSSEMTSARVPNAERLTTPARPGGRKGECKIGQRRRRCGQKTCLGSSKKGNNGNGRAPAWCTQATTSIRDKLQSQGGGEHDCALWRPTARALPRTCPSGPTATDIHPAPARNAMTPPFRRSSCVRRKCF